MKKNEAALSLLAGVFAVSLCMCLLWPGWAHSDSGIRLKNNPTLHSSSDEFPPPPHLPWSGAWWFEIANENDECDEEVKIVGTLTNDPFAQIGSKKGKTFFDGFKTDSTPPGTEALHYTLEDETTNTIFVFVDTDEDSNGCDFQGFELKVYICDTGPHCAWPACCDNWDHDTPCEPPTHEYKRTIEAFPDPLEGPAGHGSISGQVTDAATGDGLLAKIEINLIAGCVPDTPDTAVAVSRKTYTNLDGSGLYEEPNLPYGVYYVEAWVALKMDEGDIPLQMGYSVTVSEPTPNPIQNFPFTLPSGW